MKIVRIAALAAVILVAAAVAGVGRPDPAQGQAGAAADGGGITVNGVGAIATTPDVADVGFGVVTQGDTARAALAANAAAARKLAAALRGSGIAAADLQTERAVLDPRYDDEASTILGYTATTSISARIRALDKVPAIVDAAVAAGANTLSGPNLTSSRAERLYDDALKAAVADARDKASLLAGASGVTLGRVTAVVESGAGPVDAKRESLAAADAAPIEPGTQRVEASVTVTFAIG